MADVVCHPHWAVSISAGSAKWYEVRHYHDGRWYPPNWPILDAFHQVLLLIGSIKKNLNSTSDFSEGAYSTQYPSNSTR